MDLLRPTPEQGEAMDWISRNLIALRRDDGRTEYTLAQVVRAFSAGRHAGLDDAWDIVDSTATYDGAAAKSAMNRIRKAQKALAT